MPGRIFCERKIALHCIVMHPRRFSRAGHFKSEIARNKQSKWDNYEKTHSCKQDCLSNQFQLIENKLYIRRLSDPLITLLYSKLRVLLPFSFGQLSL